MISRADETIDLHLSDIDHFFQAPQIDPFLGENIGESGIDQLIDAMNARSGSGKVAVAVHLPEPMIVADLAARLQAAVANYCGAQIRIAAQKKREILLEGFKALRIGLVFWGICLALSLLIESLFGDGIMARLFGEGFIIAGWVCLWHPAELLLYEWRPFARDIKRYTQIKSMDIRLVPKTPREANTSP